MRRTVNPFPGLRSFRTDEKYLFFGREDHTAELLLRLRATRFLTVVGTSGCGKSSLVKAGVLPELHKGTMTRAGSDWEVAVMRPGGSPITNLARALVEADLFDPEQADVIEQVRATLSRSRQGLSEAARHSDLADGANLLVVIDQFEELFRFHRGAKAEYQAESERFVQLLLEASATQFPPIYVILTMRSDYLGDCTAFPGLAEAVNSSEYLIPRMNRDQRRSAIEGPVKVAGAEMAPRLLQKLLNDLGDDPDQLPILQHALMRTWDVWEAAGAEAGPLDLRHYEGAGGMREALSRHADEVFDSLPENHHRIATQFFKALTECRSDGRGIRRPTRLGKLVEMTETTEAEGRSIVEAFRAPGRSFLMPPAGVDLGMDTVIDVSHESLMRIWQRLRDWTSEEDRCASIYRRLADTARLWEVGKAGLYQDPDLQIARSWQIETRPNATWAAQYGGGFEASMAFLERSRELAAKADGVKEAARQRELEQAQQLAKAESLRAEEHARSARKLRWLVAGMALGITLALVSAMIALSARRAAQAARDQAEIHHAETRETLSNKGFRVASVLNREGKSREAVAQLCEAVRNNPSNGPATELLLSMLLFEPFAVPLYTIEAFADGGQPKFIVSSDGVRVIGYTEQSAAAWNLRSGEKLSGPIALNQGGGLFPEENVLVNYADEMAIHLIAGENCLRFDMNSGAMSSQKLAPKEFGEIGMTLRDGVAWQILAKEEGVTIIDLLNSGTALPVTFKVSGIATRALTGPKERWLAVETQGTEGNFVHLFDIQTGAQLLPAIPDGDLGKLATDPQGRVIVLGFENGMIKRLSVDQVKRGSDLTQQLPRSSVTPVALSPGANRLTAFDDKGEFLLWDLELGREVTPQTGRHEFVTRGFGQEGTIALSLSRNGQIWVWDTASRQQIPMALRNRIPGATVEFAEGGTRLLRTLESRPPEVVELPGGTVSMSLPEHTDTIELIRSDRHGERFLTATSDLLQLWQFGSPTPIGYIELDRELNDARIYPDGSMLALATDTGLSIWAIEPSGLTRKSLIDTGTFVEKLEISPDGSTLALVVGDEWSDIELRSGVSGELRDNGLLRTPDRITALKFSGDRLFSASGKHIRTWSLDSGAEIAEPILHEGLVTALAVSPDGRRLASCSLESSGATIRIWHSRTGAQLSPAIHHRDPQSLAFGAAGDRLFTGQFVWELPSGELNLPDWFIEFAEAAVGIAVAANGANEVVAPQAFLSVVGELSDRTTAGIELTFAEWFAAARSERTLSPSSTLHYRSYLDRLEAENSAPSLEEAAKLHPLKFRQ